MKAFLAMLVLAAAPVQAKMAQPLPDDSIHHLTSTFTDAKGAGFKLVDRRGTVQIVTMFYSSCAYACPLIVESVKAIDRALADEERKKLALLLVSFDPARDTVPALQKMAKERKVELPRWTLARAEAPAVGADTSGRSSGGTLDGSAGAASDRFG